MKIKQLHFLFSFLVLFSCQNKPSEQTDNTATQDPHTENEEAYEMKTYYMVFLKKGPNRDQDSLTTAALQEAHLENIGLLHEQKKLAMAGPFTHNGDLRGIFILNVETMEEAEKLVQTDPAIQAGRLAYEILPWMSARNICLP